MKLAFPEHDLVLEDREHGIWVTQHQRAYLARKWQLTGQVISIVQSAIRAGLNCLWQQGHPSGNSSHHISFSFSHSPASWIFCVGEGAGAPKVKKVTIFKKVRGLFVGGGFDPFWENAGGKNFSIVPEQLPELLDLIGRCDLKHLLATEPLAADRRYIAQTIDFQSERDLEDRIVGALETGGAKLGRQRRFRSSHFPGSHDIPDLVVDAGHEIVVVELKLYRAIQPDIIQLSRYVHNPKLGAAFENRSMAGALIAAGFDRPIRDAAAAMGNCSLYSYAPKTGLPLRLVTGADSLGKFLSA